jgi:DinB family protein
MLLIPRPAPTEYAPYYGHYVDLVGDDLLGELRRTGEATHRLLGTLPESRGDFRYAPDKWSVKEVLGHVVDGERVFAYRALWFARRDATPVPGFDQDAWVPSGDFTRRTLRSLLDEHHAVRAATLALFENLPEEAWERAGIANDLRMSVRALAFVIAGHEAHHQGILRERYLE